MIYLYNPPNSILSHPCTGNIGQWFRFEGTAAAATKAHDSKEAARGHPDPVPVALLRRRWAFPVRGHLENSSNSVAKSTAFVSFDFPCRFPTPPIRSHPLSPPLLLLLLLIANPAVSLRFNFATFEGLMRCYSILSGNSYSPSIFIIFELITSGRAASM